MAFLSSFIIFSLSVLSILCIVQAQYSTDPRDHGLAQENPISLSPSAIEFFHPNSPFSTSKPHCAASGDCAAPLPLSSFSGEFVKPEATQVHERANSVTMAHGTGIGAGEIAGIAFSCIFVVLLAMGVYYVTIKRRANINRANSVQPIV